jgi:hypothetical protein
MEVYANFSLGLDEIAEVDVRFFDIPTRSFNVKKNGTNYGVKIGGKKLPQLDTTNGNTILE